MAETKKADLNGDGKVTLKESLEYAAKIAKEEILDAAQTAKEVEAETRVKADAFAEKAVAEGKEAYAEAKVKAAEVSEDLKEAYGKAKVAAGEVADKAKAKIDEIKAKKQQ